MIRGSGYASDKNGDYVTQQKWGCFQSLKRVGYTTLKNMDRRVCDIKCQHVCGLKIVDNYQDFPKAT